MLQAKGEPAAPVCVSSRSEMNALTGILAQHFKKQQDRADALGRCAAGSLIRSPYCISYHFAPH